MGGFVDDAMGVLDPGGFMAGFSGQTGAAAAEKGAQLQSQSAQAALDYTKLRDEQARRDLAPYSLFGTSNLNNGVTGVSADSPLARYSALLDPNTQASYLKNNPIFQAALSNANTKSANTYGFSGLRGDLASALTKNYMAAGDSVINQQTNRLLAPIQIGQNSAAGSAVNGLNTAGNVSNLLTQQGNAMAAGGIGAANAQAQGASNILQGAGIAASFFSDERLKREIKKLGEDESGLGIYEFEYKDTAPKFIGYMAQEVADKDPENILLDPSGYLKVTQKYAPARIA